MLKKKKEEIESVHFLILKFCLCMFLHEKSPCSHHSYCLIEVKKRREWLFIPLLSFSQLKVMRYRYRASDLKYLNCMQLTALNIQPSCFLAFLVLLPTIFYHYMLLMFTMWPLWLFQGHRSNRSSYCSFFICPTSIRLYSLSQADFIKPKTVRMERRYQFDRHYNLISIDWIKMSGWKNKQAWDCIIYPVFPISITTYPLSWISKLSLPWILSLALHWGIVCSCHF